MHSLSKNGTKKCIKGSDGTLRPDACGPRLHHIDGPQFARDRVCGHLLTIRLQDSHRRSLTRVGNESLTRCRRFCPEKEHAFAKSPHRSSLHPYSRAGRRHCVRRNRLRRHRPWRHRLSPPPPPPPPPPPRPHPPPPSSSIRSAEQYRA